MNSIITKGIKVTMEGQYMPESSNPTLRRFIHKYRITIENLSTQRVKLLDRWWIITDGDGNKKEVRGEGVVGEQPTILPGRSYSYESWCPLSFPTGKMEGSFGMIDEELQEKFSIQIPPTTLTADFKYN